MWGDRDRSAIIKQILPKSILLPLGSIYYSCLFDIIKTRSHWLRCPSPVPCLNHLLNKLLNCVSCPHHLPLAQFLKKYTLSNDHAFCSNQFGVSVIH